MGLRKEAQMDQGEPEQQTKGVEQKGSLATQSQRRFAESVRAYKRAKRRVMVSGAPASLGGEGVDDSRGQASRYLPHVPDKGKILCQGAGALGLTLGFSDAAR